MPTVLDEIIAGVREDLAARQAATPLDEVRRLAEAASSNLYAVGTAGVAAVAFTAWTLAAAMGRELPLRRHATGLLVAWFVGLVLFGVVRLLPGMSALRP